MADRINRQVNISDEDKFTYLVIPDLRTNVQTIRHQTLVRTEVPPGDVDQTMREAAELIDQLAAVTQAMFVTPNQIETIAKLKLPCQRDARESQQTTGYMTPRSTPSARLQ